MALVYTEGFETHPMWYHRYDILSDEAAALGFSGISYANKNVLNKGPNGFVSLFTSNNLSVPSRITMSNVALQSGVVSFLSYNTPGNSPASNHLGHILIGVGAGTTQVVLVRVSAAYNSFPNIGYTMELFAGGVQVGTFEWPYDTYHGTWARWTLVWDTSGPNVTAALYRDGVYVIDGTGGSDGAGTALDTFSFTSRVSYNVDSITVWDDPVGDLNAANTPHWVAGVYPASQVGGNSTLGDFRDFSGTNRIGAQYDIVSGLRSASRNDGLLTTQANSVVEAQNSFQSAITDATAVYGVRLHTFSAATGALTTATQALSVSGSTTGQTSVIPGDLGYMESFSVLDPSTGSPWSASNKVTLLDPEGRGGFESGTTFGANGWVAVNDIRGGAGWHCGSGADLSGLRGAFVSKDGVDTSDVSRGTGNAYSHLYYEFTVPEGITQVQLAFQARRNLSSGYGNIEVFLIPSSVGISGGSQIIYSAASGVWSWDVSLDPNTSFYYTPIGFILLNTNQEGSYSSNTKPVTPGESYRLVFTWFTGATNAVASDPIAVDNVALYGYGGGVADLTLRFGAL